eukprot:CAMPEP_0170615258 /NCGR_PEP_ID=MMETSP0224-20130122/25240_1 /TAXON_ID=285029 /ORGANISM="Togula jolla, Strain CCCM 725" /LENGTH=374 /DNA_ID=CAMNT_0010940975 /DNA_START=1 /DNA_END=1125 /DNA_ORIENTATION=+
MFQTFGSFYVTLLLLPWPLSAIQVLPRIVPSPVDAAGSIWKQADQEAPASVQGAWQPSGQGEQTSKTEAQAAWPNQHPQGGEGPARCPSLFAAVFTRRDDIERRALVRPMWQDASKDWGQVVARFAVCSPVEGEDPSLQARLLQESETYNDLMLLDCEEGYLNGTLTRKVLASMHAFLLHYSQLQLFMKIDDDTFITPHRLCDLMVYRHENNLTMDSVYMGVFAETAAGEQMKIGNPVVRDPSSPFYEPMENYPEENFPVSAKGGPGYILPKRAVKQIAARGIGPSNILNNEDKSVAVWVDQLKKGGEQLDFVNLKGTDGYEEHKAFIPTTGKWSDYPFILHHHLSGETISCLHQVDMAGQPERLIDPCFQEEA